MEVSQSAAVSAAVPAREKLQRWAGAALGQAGDRGCALRIVDQHEMSQLNSSYAGRDKATNVLSFPSSEAFADLPRTLLDALDAEHRSLGDIAICAEVVAHEAAQQNKTLDAHWAHMIVHGVLHLRGYDHVKDEEAQLMEAEEVRIMASLGFPDPYHPAQGSPAQRDRHE